MAVVEGQVSFEVLSETVTAAAVTQRLGLLPTSAVERGELVGNGRCGRRAKVAAWSLTRDYADGPNPLNAALLALISQFDGCLDEIDELQGHCDVRVRCWGSSDSGQGGFWLSPEVTQRLGRLNAEFHCTVYLEDSPPDVGS